MGSLQSNGGSVPSLSPRVFHSLHPPHLEDRHHIGVGVEQEGRESGVGAWPGQHSHHTASCHLERARRRGRQCTVRSCPRPTSPTHAGPQAHLHFLTAQAQLAGSLLKEGHGSPWEHSLAAASASPHLPRAQAEMGVHPEKGADPCLNTIPHPSETSASLSPRKKTFLASDPL